MINPLDESVCFLCGKSSRDDVCDDCQEREIINRCDFVSDPTKGRGEK